MADTTTDKPLRYAVIGAGMAGLLAAIKLHQRGEPHIAVYEKAQGVGGTWREIGRAHV